MGKTRVVVAMSGGVDSSVAAALLVQQGYDVIGIMLRLWAEDGNDAHGQPNTNRCCAPEAVVDARAIARQLGIPFYDIHAEAVFKQRVVEPWINAYAEATTPNPCFNCNRSIRFGFLMQRALALGAEYLATGHYARVERPLTADRGPQEIAGGLRSAVSGPAFESPARYKLLKGHDPKKDQSYVLHVLGQRDLARAMFPCGGYVKDEVRALARAFGLPTAERPESQDLCFLTQGDYRGFLKRNAPDIATPGPIVTSRGEVIGQHEGLPYYTVGQRKGLQIHATSSDAEPWYVLRLDAARNAVVAGPLRELGASSVRVGAMHYCADVAPGSDMRASARIRYKAKEAEGWLRPLSGDGARFDFDAPQRDATPGQGLVVYSGDEVIGGGVIVREASASTSSIAA